MDKKLIKKCINLFQYGYYTVHLTVVAGTLDSLLLGENVVLIFLILFLIDVHRGIKFIGGGRLISSLKNLSHSCALKHVKLIARTFKRTFRLNMLLLLFFFPKKFEDQLHQV